MGLEIQVDTLEDMCALMCDNYIPKKGEKTDDERRGCKGNERSDTDVTVTISDGV